MTKEQLRQYRSIKIEISQIESRLATMRVFDPIAADITHPLVQLYREQLKELISGQLRIEKAIESLNPTERELMRMRYIDGAEWLDICETIHYEWTQTHRIHARALNKIKNL